MVLSGHQIRYKPDIMYDGKVMSDGAGRVSLSIALKIVEKLGLTFRPSGFQCRIGNAKGFWSICPTDTSLEDWIEVYDSQCKWQPSTEKDGISDHSSHRTLEVLAYSMPLKSAALNHQFVPLILNGARDPGTMRKTMAHLLEEELAREIVTLQAAMENTQSLRKWVREVCPTTQERLRRGGVAFQAGLPISKEERLNLLLDAGFDLKSLRFVKEMTKTVLKNQFEDLQTRLSITIGKSTNVFMVPDFTGTLKEGEIYLDFSHFTDDVSGFSGYLLNGVDVLVARNPAHLVSDVQKVRAVFKVELMGLKDVIVFPTKGRCLADMLSGGDYDGDRAFVLWEPSIVDNFVSVEIPTLPDLVEEGYLRKESTTYEELTKCQSKPISTFLKKAFAFTMQPGLLGICTSHKNAVCYDVGRIDTDEALYLSTLVNALVDASKQGCTFLDSDWTRFKADKVKTIPRRPRVEEKNDRVGPHAEHIFDYLKWVAKKSIDAALTKFHKGLADPPMWDDDLTGYHDRARDLALREPLWAKLLKDLRADIEPLRKANRQHNSIPENSRPPWTPYILQAHDEFHAIVPRDITIVSETLLLDSPSDPQLSSWALLKASTLFASYSKNFVSNFVWYLAGKQLCVLKAKAVGGMFALAPSMYAMSKPDNQYVKALLCEEPLMSFGGDVRAVVDEEILEELIDDC